MITQLAQAFTRWLREGRVPIYCKEAKVFALSKTGSEFPPVGDIRTISVLPAVFKVYEKVVLARLTKNLNDVCPLSEN